MFRYPKSISYVIMDWLEKAYLAGFPLLLLFVSAFPLWQGRSAGEVAASVESCVASDGFTCPDAKLGVTKQASPGVTVSAMDFLPLMLTSVYCSIGLIWSFLRLGFIYLNEETKYQGQLSEVK